MKNNKTLGILGGLGPMATAYFYEMLTAHTQAASDADHIDMVISSRATTPDRTAFIVGRSDNDPRPAMCEDAKRLEQWGCDLIAIPCNTAHYFYDSIQCSVNIPVLNIMRETASHLHRTGIRCAGLLATDGTVQSRTYEKYLSEAGIECVTPNPEDQEQLMHLIYGQIKNGQSADFDIFLKISDGLREKGAEALILGCTELSLIGKEHTLPSFYVDSMEVLAKSTIIACEKPAAGFSF